MCFFTPLMTKFWKHKFYKLCFFLCTFCWKRHTKFQLNWSRWYQNYGLFCGKYKMAASRWTKHFRITIFEGKLFHLPSGLVLLERCNTTYSCPLFWTLRFHSFILLDKSVKIFARHVKKITIQDKCQEWRWNNSKHLKSVISD